MLIVGTAALAGTGEGQLAISHSSSGLTCRPAAKAFGDLHMGQIDDTVAAGADEVDVRLNIAVEPLHTVHRTETLNDSLLFKTRQVPVHSTQ